MPNNFFTALTDTLQAGNDKKIYDAVRTLGQRPTVPIETFDHTADLTPYGYAKGGTKRGMALLGGFTPREHDKIMVNREGYGYPDNQKLAAIIGHEQDHVNGGDERHARAREVEVLNTFGGAQRDLVNKIRKQYALK